MSDHLDYFTVRNSLRMAREEAYDVRDAASEHLDELRVHKSKHVFVFRQIDHYVPLSYVDDLKREIGDDVVCSCQRSFRSCQLIFCTACYRVQTARRARICVTSGS